jgi:hypothetical protein
MRNVFSTKQKGKYPKDNVYFDEVITIKKQMMQVYFIRRSYFLEKLGIYSNT